MPKNIVVCCDGTGNQVERNLSNVLKLFRISIKDESQRVYYGSGIGTIGTSDEWTRRKQDAQAIFALGTGYGLDTDILGAYSHVCRHYERGDAIFLFGFSRGAYTARAVAGLIHVIGLLAPDQLNIAGYGLRAYKQASSKTDEPAGESKMLEAFNFGKIAGARRARIKFLGVWDTVASVLVPRGDRVVPQLLTLPYTRKNPSVEIFRHAVAIDERRRMFRLNRWIDDQVYVVSPFADPPRTAPQDVKQVWFAGVHADIGGGYAEKESALSKYPLNWIINEAVAKGLKINAALRNYLVLGQSRPGWPDRFVAPDYKGDLHTSMRGLWRLLELVPKSTKFREWSDRKALFDYYLPRSEPRRIELDSGVTPRVHESAVLRRDSIGTYKPENFPETFVVEPL